MATCSDHQLIAALRALDRSGEFDIESLDLAPPSNDTTLERCLLSSLEQRIARLENAVFRHIELSSADGGDMGTAADEVKDEAKSDTPAWVWSTTEIPQTTSEMPPPTKRIVYSKSDLHKMRNEFLSEGPVSRPSELDNYFPRKVEFFAGPAPSTPPSISSTAVPSRIVTIVPPPPHGKIEDNFRQTKASPGLFAHLQSPRGQYPKKSSGNGGGFGGEEEEDIKKPYAHGGGGGSRDHRDNYQNTHRGGDARGGDRGDKDTTRSDHHRSGGMRNNSNNEVERYTPAFAPTSAEIPIGGSKIDFAALIAAAAVKDETKEDTKRSRDNRERESRGSRREEQQRRDNRSGHKTKEKTEAPPEKAPAPMKTEYQYGLVVRSPSDV